VVVIHHDPGEPADVSGSSQSLASDGAPTPRGDAQLAGAPASAHLAATSAPAPDRAMAISSSASGQNAQEVNLKTLLESGDPRSNILVWPGDVVKVTRAGIVYVIGEVKKPGGFELKSNENITVLQAVALANGVTRTSAQSQTRIIRTDPASGVRSEIHLDLAKVLAGKVPDPTLQPRDILFIPNSASRSALYRGLDAALTVGTGLAIYHP
jgi:polysaccharide biosynthesis/export protein